MLQFLRRTVRSILGVTPAEVTQQSAAPTTVRLTRPWREDALHTHPTVGLTPSRLLAILQSASAGSPATQYELFAEMLQKWPRLAAVEATRRLALTGLDWEIMPAEREARTPREALLSRRAAEHCTQVLTRLDAFRETLDHLAHAIGFGLALAELVWEDGGLADIVPVPHTRLTGDSDDPWRIRVRTASASTDGVPVERDAAKWVVHQPRTLVGRPFEGGLLRASALLYLAQNLSFKDWLIYSQLAGMPVRVGQFEPGAPEADKQALLRMLEKLGTDSAAIFSKNVDVKLLEARSAGERPYAPLQHYCNTEVTILWLGQHLTTDVRESGSRAAAEIHDRVREDLLVDDMKQESETIRRCVLTPMVRARFGDEAPVPHFRRSLIQSVDTKVLAETLAVAVGSLGLEVPARWVHRALGIPQPEPGEPTLTRGAKR